MKKLTIMIVLTNIFYTLMVNVSNGKSAGSIIQSFRITADTTAINPFTVGLIFKKGEVINPPTLDIDDYQIMIKKRWSDNSIKHVIASGSVAMTADIPKTINVYGDGTPPTGLVLTESDIVAAAPSASVELGDKGTVNLSSLLGSPVRVWLSGISMVEAHYQTDIISDLSVWFYVRLYKTGDIWIRVIVENGDVTGASNESYTAKIMVDGNVVYNKAITHYAYTRYAVEGWVSSSGPDITIAHDTEYLMRTKLVPNYWKKNTSASTLNELSQNYTPFSRCDWTERMGSAGFQNQIGLLPLWDALYLSSGGDYRAYKSVIANSNAIFSYAIIWSDKTTNKPIKLTDYSSWTCGGPGQGGYYEWGAGSLIWEKAHHGSAGYLAYLITGDYYYLEAMEYQATLCYLMETSDAGNDASRIIRGQTRAVAWQHRTLGQLIAIAPKDEITTQLSSWLNYNLTYWESVRNKEGMNKLGYLYEYNLAAYEPGYTAPWMQHFWIQTYGMMKDIEPFDTSMLLDSLTTFLYQAAVGILGSTGSENYCFTKASSYTIKISDGTNGDPATWYDSWGTVYEKTWGQSNTSCGNRLEGSSGGNPADGSTGYWGNLFPAISYAVDHKAKGSTEAWQRLTGAENFSTFENSGFDDIPIWGIYPRDTSGDQGDGDNPSRPVNVRVIR